MTRTYDYDKEIQERRGMTPSELNEATAKWLGYKTFSRAQRTYCKAPNERTYKPFDPYHDKNDLMDKVMPKLITEHRLVLDRGKFVLDYTTVGKYEDFSRAVLELVAELAMEGK